MLPLKIVEKLKMSPYPPWLIVSGSNFRSGDAETSSAWRNIHDKFLTIL